MDKVTRKNIRIYYAIQLLTNLSFFLPIYILFGREYLGLSYTQVATLTLTVLVTSLLFDFIMGVFADTISRKKSFLIGTFLSLLGVLSYVFTKDYSVLLIFSVVGGIGLALESSTLDTLIHDFMTESENIEHYPSVTSTAQQMLFIGRMVASIVGGLLFVVSPVFPYIAYAGVLVVAFVLGTQISDMKIIPKKKRQSFANTFVTAFEFLKKRNDILLFILSGSVTILFADLLFGYYQPYFQTFKISPIVIGAVYAGISLLSATGSHLMKKMLKKYSALRINQFVTLGGIGTVVLLMPHLYILVLVAPLVMALASGFLMPNLRNYLNSRSPSEIKTSVLSYGTTSYNLGTMIGLFLAGFLADKVSPMSVLLIILAGSVLALAFNFSLSKLQKVN